MANCSQSLPQELLDEIIEHTSYSDLANCALTSRSFRASSQRRTFSSIRLSPQDQSSFTLLAEIFATSPTLPAYVRFLQIEFAPGALQKAAFPNDSAPLLQRFEHILALLTGVTTLSICTTDGVLHWGAVLPRARAAIRGAMSAMPLAKLRLRHINFSSTAQLSELVNSSARLSCLSLVHVDPCDPTSESGPVQTETDDHRLDIATDIHSLTLHGHYLLVLSDALRSDPPGRHLTHLTLYVVGPTILTRALDSLGERVSKLQSLCLNMWSTFPLNTLVIPRPFPSLRTLELFIILAGRTDVKFRDSCLALHETPGFIDKHISSLSPNGPLDQFTLTCMSIGPPDPTPFDTYLPDLLRETGLEASLIASGVQRFSLGFPRDTFEIIYPPNPPQECDPTLYRQAFPRLHERGIMEFACGYSR